MRSFRTAGGHRRVLEEDVRGIVAKATTTPAKDADRISGLALTRVRRRINRGRQTHSLAVFDGFTPDTRDRLRLTGRQMVDLFARYISSGTRGERFNEDAQTIGRDYGRTLVDAHVGLTNAIAIFNRMRRPLEETASQIAQEAGLPADEAVEAVEDTLELMDRVLEGMASVYEARLMTEEPAGR